MSCASARWSATQLPPGIACLLLTSDNTTPSHGVGTRHHSTPAGAPLLYGVAPLDPVSFTAAAGLLYVAALIATLVPVQRAAWLDPLRSLRTE